MVVNDEDADVPGISASSAKRDSTYARASVIREFTQDGSESTTSPPTSY